MVKLCTAFAFLGLLAAQELDYITQIKNTPELDVRKYQWFRTNGLGVSADLSAPGAKTLTFAKAPLGVAGTNTNHYIRIYDGVGTPEVALITGGTCTSGGTNCTIQVTTTQAHTGAWKAGTATAGMQEAVWELPVQGGTVQINSGSHRVYATTTVARSAVRIIGQGTTATEIYTTYTDGPVFYLGGTGQNHIKAMQIRGPNSGSNYAIQLHNQNTSGVEEVYITQVGGGITITGTGSTYVVRLRDVNINYFTLDAVRIADGAGHFLSGLEIGGTGVSASNGIHILASGGTWVIDTDVVQAGNGLLIDPDTSPVNWLWFTNAVFDTCVVNGITINPSSNGSVYGVNFVNSWTASATENGVMIGSAGTIDGVRFIGHRAVANKQQGFILYGGSNIVIEASTIAGNSASPSASAAYHGVYISPGVSDFQIRNSTIAQTDTASNVQGYGIVVGGGASDDYVITGNVLSPNVTGALLDGGTGTNKIIKDNKGIDDVIPTIAAGATFTLPLNRVVKVSGTTQITTLAGGWKGRTVDLIFTDAAPGGVGTGDNIARTQTAVQNQVLRLTFDGTNWY